MPSVFQSDSYQATVEVNILDKNYSMVTQEYLDYQNNIGAIIAFRNGVKTQVIYSYRSGEIFEINFDGLSTCTVKNMSTSPYVSYLGPMFNNINGDIRHIFGSSAALNFASNSSYVYTGTGTVRGLPVNIWTTCLTYPNTKTPIQVTFYFSQPGWNTSWSQQQMPLRVEIKGVTQSSTFGSLTTQATPRYFHHMYDFINYLPTVDPTSSVFQPPRRVACVNRVNTHPRPIFQSTFTYKVEIINPVDHAVTHSQIWYDARARLVREDTRTLHPDFQVRVNTTVTEIHDFNTDVRYIIDLRGGCMAFAMDNKQPDARFWYNQSILIDMKDPNSFFQFNDDYKYVGQRLVRGITCDVFSTVIPDFNAGGQSVNATFEYYFLPPNWNDISLFGLEAYDMGYPVQLVISADTVGYTRIHNFFDFGHYFVQADVFDATMCFQPNKKMKVSVTFPGHY
uniref:LolA-like domain-containing protein n=1 Tax=Biomphalaria glabrata TaxID=6526 RepID=A0A2C9JY44_BIOGL